MISSFQKKGEGCFILTLFLGEKVERRKRKGFFLSFLWKVNSCLGGGPEGLFFFFGAKGGGFFFFGLCFVFLGKGGEAVSVFVFFEGRRERRRFFFFDGFVCAPRRGPSGSFPLFFRLKTNSFPVHEKANASKFFSLGLSPSFFFLFVF